MSATHHDRGQSRTHATPFAARGHRGVGRAG